MILINSHLLSYILHLTNFNLSFLHVLKFDGSKLFSGQDYIVIVFIVQV